MSIRWQEEEDKEGEKEGKPVGEKEKRYCMCGLRTKVK